MIYTVIDVETTGRGNKITEISIFKTDGKDILDEFTSLVNPEALIPTYITALTGIDNRMVADAPTFAEIAEQVEEITKDSVFVAHNVNFDYNVIRNEFKELSIDFRRKKLCTVRLSRKVYPKLRSYSLGKLCKSLKIKIVDRHRARGDAEATTTLFNQILAQPNSNKILADCFKRSSKESTLPPNLAAEVFNKLPSSTGIYFFKDKKGKIIYVGKAKNIKKRVLSHFYNKSDKELTICRETADLDFKLSGTELIALLMEDAAIKHHFPKYNRASKKPVKTYAIFKYEDRQGIFHLAYNASKHIGKPIQTFYTLRDCRLYLEEICEKFNLCPKYCHLQEDVIECSHFKLQGCLGVCRGEEKFDDYNKRVDGAIDWLTKQSKNIIIKQRGRSNDEEAFIMMKNGKYLGYGFVGRDEQISRADQLEAFLIRQRDNNDVRRILGKSMLQQNSYFKFNQEVAV